MKKIITKKAILRVNMILTTLTSLIIPMRPRLKVMMLTKMRSLAVDLAHLVVGIVIIRVLVNLILIIIITMTMIDMFDVGDDFKKTFWEC